MTAGSSKGCTSRNLSDPIPDAEWPTRALRHVANAFPELSGLRVAHAWAGAIDTMPDLLPVIAHVQSIPGLVIASGFSGHGFVLGPGAGMLVSRVVMNEAPATEMKPYRLTPFSDGTPIKSPEMM